MAYMVNSIKKIFLKKKINKIISHYPHWKSPKNWKKKGPGYGEFSK